MRKIDYSKAASKRKMQTQGAESITGELPARLFDRPKRRLSKADARAVVEEATARITRHIQCICGHSASIAVPPSKARARLRCSKCGKIAPSSGDKR